MRLYAIFTVLCLLVMGCTENKTILTDYENVFGLDNGVSREFHTCLYYPKGLALQYPGYLVGVQKAEQWKVNGPQMAGYPSYMKSEPAPYFKDEQNKSWGLGTTKILQKVSGDKKSLFIAHITRYTQTIARNHGKKQTEDAERGYGYIDQCSLYNVFNSKYFVASKTEAEAVDLSRVLAWGEACGNAPKWNDDSEIELNTTGFYENGTIAFKALSDSVARDIVNNDYTHVLVIVMGWNTAQDEAIRNFNDIVGNIMAASLEAKKANHNSEDGLPFRPLVVGITWPSFWSTGWWNAFSYSDKADDADELGISWLNLLVNEVLPGAIEKANSKVPLVVIGHSFGARAVTRAAFSSPALKHSAGDMVQSKAALVIGLQGAVSINRFNVNAGDEGGPYRDFAKLRDTQIVLTASSYDAAAGGPVFWYDPAGAIGSFNMACNGDAGWRTSAFECYKAHENSGTRQKDGAFTLCDKQGVNCKVFGKPIEGAQKTGKIMYIDASDGVTRFNTIGTGGNAHSDIYRLPMGRLLWTMIQSYAYND